MTSDDKQYILGLDIGANSIGWALFEPDPGYAEGLEPGKLVWDERGPAMGAHVFEAGVENYFGSGQGKEESRNAKRRLMRAQRRMGQRRARRQAKTYNCLASAGLLPALAPGPEDSRAERDAALKDLDRRLSAGLRPEQYARLPYYLRTRALDEGLEPEQLGRALYHLAQRRGFLSNRKDADKEDEDEKGKVKGQIAELDAAIDPSGAEGKARTLGEHFYRIGSQEIRVRKRYTSRKQYKDEFEAIWSAQQPHHPQVLTEDFKKRLHDAIFHQRPLKSQAHLIGACDIYDGVRHKPARRRSPMHLLCVQRFRYLQKVNDLQIVGKEGESRPLTTEERDKLIHMLECNKDLKFSDAKKLLNLPRHYKFNLEAGGEKGFKGNRTAADMIEVFGEKRWFALHEADRNRAVEDVYSILDDDALRRRAESAWELSKAQAEALADIRLESDYASLSRQAIEALLPLMEQGKPFATARKELFGEVEAQPVREMLPPVTEFLPSLRNPVVSRSLTELRRLVNAIIRRFGKPALIRVELAREMQKNAKVRDEILKQNRQRQREREQAADRISKECGIRDPKASDIEKVLLWDECSGVCPYTGRPIPFCDLFGRGVDVEHIIPFSRYLDNTFANKTLCWAEENRNRKRNKTPFEAYSESELASIISRVERFKGDERTIARKLERFNVSSSEELDELFGGFTEADMRNTAYASRLALDFLGTLFGLHSGGSHRHDATGVQRIQPVNGGVTSKLREEWGLLSIIGKREDGKKSRDDHRHHAVDAACVAMTSRRTVQILQTAAARAVEQGRRRFGGKNAVPQPYPEFYDQVRQAVERVNVSHRVDKRVSGPIHEETIYSPPRNEHGQRHGDGPYTHVRKEVDKLSDKDIANIVDKKVRERVELKLNELGWTGKAFASTAGKKHPFADPKQHPTLPTKDGRQIPIHKVRIRKKNTVERIGHGVSERHVQLGNNHHVEIIQTIDKKGKPKWEMRFVTMLEAYQRQKEGKPIVNRTVGPDEEFICSLVGGDAFIWEAEKGNPEIFRVRTLDAANLRIAFVRNRDARQKKSMLDGDKQASTAAKQRGGKRSKAEKSFQEESALQLQAGGFQKVIITPLGDVRPVHD
ncbi:MAG: type II CRISPR RNA-guided endonuclease Cas9 [Planctomycetes bacterium]|nr:type II CRISPR RNA-guided endonuclease Cas9 [Planctomycetota bacterium]MCW8135617.1 type II CRISPR RNA-guided endonuclease Cas9 [Planctomycetota bacterium]